MFDNEADLRRFLLVGRRGSAAEACEALGISKAAYYRTINWIVERVMSAERHDDNIRKAADDQASVEFKELLLALVLRHPTWGCERFARELRQNLAQVSTNMVANLLRELCLDSRRARIEKLIVAVIGRQLSELSEEQAKAIAQVNPLVNDTMLFRAEDELVFGITLVPAFDLLGPHGYVQLFVELRSLFTYGRLIRKTQDTVTNHCIGRDNDSDLALIESMTKKPLGRVYWFCRSWGLARLSAYRPLPVTNGPTRSCTTVRKPPAGLAMMRKRLSTEWVSSCSPATGQNDAAVKESLLEWFCAHNSSSTENIFPTGGRAPADILGLDLDQMRCFLARSLSDDERQPLRWGKRTHEVRTGPDADS